MAAKNERYADFIYDIIRDNASIEYRRIALEGFSNSNTQAKLIQILYKDIIDKKKIKNKDIDDTKGNITKLFFYDKMLESIDILKKLFQDNIPKELTLVFELHEMILNCRSDFEFGYKTNIELIQIIYTVLVASLLELINMSISKYVNYLKYVNGINFPSPTQTENRMIVLQAEKFLNCYKHGDWNKLMKTLTSNRSNLFLGTTVAKVTYTVLAALTVTGIVIVASLAILSTIRELIYYFYKTSVNISEYLKVQNEFLKVSLKSLDTNTNAYRYQKIVSDKLENLSDFIDSKILKQESSAKKIIAISNQEIFSKENMDKERILEQPVEKNTIPNTPSDDLYIF